jgi:hypothetical protein
MATALQDRSTAPLSLPGKRYDRIFFSSMVILLIASVAIGFAHTYYLAGVINAPLPSRVIQVHGAVFSLWMILLLVQSGLVSAKKVALHRKLGVAGFIFACLMVVVALMAGANLLTRANTFPDPHATITLAIVPFSNALEFAVLAGFAYALRRNSAAHKRLIIVATTAIVSAAFFRVQVPWLYHIVQNDYLASYMFLAILAAYDLWALHKIHRATLWGSALVIAVNQVGLLLGPTAPWHAVARVIQSWGV